MAPWDDRGILRTSLADLIPSSSQLERAITRTVLEGPVPTHGPPRIPSWSITIFRFKWISAVTHLKWVIPDESPLRMSETYSCLFLFDIELKFIEEDIIFILKGFTSCFFFRECDESKTSSRSSGVTQVHSYMFHLTEFTKNGIVNRLSQLP